MPDSNTLRTALRVLTAVTDRQNPEPDDVASLIRYAPDLEHLAADGLACAIIQRALKARNEREKAQGTA
ncbi:MAG: hypothetical protein WBY44_26435 [Bryobacteraceae bacterium]|jgi:hypothetical protein